MLRIHITNSGTFHTTFTRTHIYRDFPVITFGGRMPTFGLNLYGSLFGDIWTFLRDILTISEILTIFGELAKPLA